MSTAWRILVTDGLSQQGLQLLREQAEVIESPELTRCDALIVRGRTAVTAHYMRQVTGQLKVIGRAGVGVDNIDLEAARQHQITVVNAPQAVTTAVAELTFGLMLALARRIPHADASMRQGNWIKKELYGSQLSGKQLGIVGMGRIGAAVAERAAAFGMTVVGHDPPLGPEEIERRGARPVGLQELLGQSDYVCLHLPLSESTQGMIGAEELAGMKPGARLVSAARGGIIDETALLEALNRGQVAGAGLDVFATEPPGKWDLIQHPNVVSTPHIGAQTTEAQTQTGIDIATEVLAALQGEPLRWRVV